ncbi:MAG: hypothetical protein A2087_00685 [Spirochaetes bacterium GWD1_61_31]|nr:MAG: hypothetical protein A2Y37_03110 [Spirochaetes bacterium GWB1_60_80]OHD29600.1 MAG: hypothetical protein A2004_01645 [Spirochaetes bacterium GWC1_61_12]OHD37504.1 MAG: hypothetical protein A2087_00685 [Spirochaetes bacterium GWD1_61_31]OHD41986.1 MAG: hypothetical protein A2Y35_14580 [Spirochaetes bacterium GWE1_60_18]
MGTFCSIKHYPFRVFKQVLIHRIACSNEKFIRDPLPSTSSARLLSEGSKTTWPTSNDRCLEATNIYPQLKGIR